MATARGSLASLVRARAFALVSPRAISAYRARPAAGKLLLLILNAGRKEGTIINHYMLLLLHLYFYYSTYSLLDLHLGRPFILQKFVITALCYICFVSIFLSIVKTASSFLINFSKSHHFLSQLFI